MNDDLPFQGQLGSRRALVTGGTRGIGAAVARVLASAGVDVSITGTGNRALREGPFRYLQADFSDPQDTEAFARSIQDQGFDILVNNAGINVIAPFTRVDLGDFDRVMAVNVRAPFALCQAVLPHMVANHWGRICNISSIWGVVSKSQRASYSTSKFALRGLTGALSAEYAELGILVNALAPGFIQTALTDSVLGADGIRDIVTQIPAGRLGTVDEVARAVGWMVSEENTYMSGHTLVIDGGFVGV